MTYLVTKSNRYDVSSQLMVIKVLINLVLMKKKQK
jgi:hypothetical protein